MNQVQTTFTTPKSLPFAEVFNFSDLSSVKEFKPSASLADCPFNNYNQFATPYSVAHNQFVSFGKTEWCQQLVSEG